MTEAFDIAKMAVAALEDKKAQDIKLLHTTDVTILADYFVICTATSTTHLRTLADFLDIVFKKENISPRRREGENNSEWILVDCGPVVVHIFLEKGREFYNLESFWSAAENIDLESLA